MLRLPPSPDDEAPPPAAAARHGSAAEAVGEEILSAAVDLPWDDWLGSGAADRVRDGSLAVVRHAYPAAAARDMRSASTTAGMLTGDAAARERLAAVAVGIAGAHAAPARMPHAPGSEPSAWWIADERVLVWMPWADAGEPYGLELLDTGQATAVTVTAPDAVWTAFRTDVPRRGARGRWPDLPERFRAAVLERSGAERAALERAALWWRRGDVLTVRWREGRHLRTVAVDLTAIGVQG